MWHKILFFPFLHSNSIIQTVWINILLIETIGTGSFRCSQSKLGLVLFDVHSQNWFPSASWSGGPIWYTLIKICLSFTDFLEWIVQNRIQALLFAAEIWHCIDFQAGSDFIKLSFYWPGGILHWHGLTTWHVNVIMISTTRYYQIKSNSMYNRVLNLSLQFEFHR